MNLLHKFALSIATELAKADNRNEEDREVLAYSIEDIIMNTIEIGSILLLAKILNVFLPSVIIAIIWMMIRKYNGGHHMSAFMRCWIFSTVMIVGAGIIVKNSYSYLNALYMVIIIIAVISFAFYNTNKYAPKDHPNKPITNPKQIAKLRKGAFITLFILNTISFILLILGFIQYALAICISIFIASSTINPLCIKFYKRLDKRG